MNKITIGTFGSDAIDRPGQTATAETLATADFKEIFTVRNGDWQACQGGHP